MTVQQDIKKVWKLSVCSLGVNYMLSVTLLSCSFLLETFKLSVWS